MKKIDILFFLLLMAGVVGIYHFFIGQGRSIKAQNPYKHELYKEQVLRRKAMAAQNKKKRSSSKSKKGAKHK